MVAMLLLELFVTGSIRVSIPLARDLQKYFNDGMGVWMQWPHFFPAPKVCDSVLERFRVICKGVLAPLKQNGRGRSLGMRTEHGWVHPLG